MANTERLKRRHEEQRRQEAADQERVEKAVARYKTATHAMQSGVAVKQGLDPTDTLPKHLRVGVNAAMVEQAALVRLLIDKGLVTEAEYVEALADKMEAEVESYKKWLQERTGAEIHLH